MGLECRVWSFDGAPTDGVSRSHQRGESRGNVCMSSACETSTIVYLYSTLYRVARNVPSFIIKTPNLKFPLIHRQYMCPDKKLVLTSAAMAQTVQKVACLEFSYIYIKKFLARHFFEEQCLIPLL